MKYISIQYLRAIAAFMVVLVHLSLQEQKIFSQEPLLGIFQVGTAGVDIFFVISGFIMMLILFKKKEKKIFLKKRIIRIYPIYWIYLSLIMLVILYKPSLVNANGELVLFYAPHAGNIYKTALTPVTLDANKQMTLQPGEVKPFFIENEFNTALAPDDYTIEARVVPAGE
jgi:peptidoglycan/LPS O-acetylase OafA/YrhL